MTTTPGAPMITLDGVSLTVPDLVDAARRTTQITATDASIAALDEVQSRLHAARASGAVYGANTGVGANRGVSVGDSSDTDVTAAHARRLLRSHCAAVGPIEDDVTARAAMIVRLNQFLAGGSGISSSIGRGLREAIANGSVPTLHRLGAIGTADLAALAELALTLSGDRPWRVGGIPPVALADSDALPFMSSSAVTLATASVATQDLAALQRSSLVVAALSFLALRGSPEAYDRAVHEAKPHPHQVETARTLSTLIGSATPEAATPEAATPEAPASEAPTSESPAAADSSRPARLQDPFGLRVVPQVHAPAAAAIEALTSTLEVEINSAAENPLVTADGVRHHGQFHLATLASALDHARASIYPTLTLSAARLGLLLRSEMTGLAPFLAADSPGSSGLMITEYVVQDALAELRSAVAPVSGSSVSISLGMEEHASFATQGARRLRDVAATAPLVLAIEAVAAVRALRMSPERLRAAPVRRAYEFLAENLDADSTDRILGEDIARAVELLPSLSQFIGDGL